MMGKKSGRICLIYQVDFSEDYLEYRTLTKNGVLEGIVQSNEQLYDTVSDILEFHSTERVEIALKFLRFNKIGGICPKSFPKSELTIKLLSLLNLCVGGETGIEIKHLPFDGNILEQPNIFIQAHYIWSDEYSKYVKTLKSKTKSDETRR